MNERDQADRQAYETLTDGEREALRALREAVGVNRARDIYVTVAAPAQANAIAGLAIRATSAKLIRAGLAKRAAEQQDARDQESIGAMLSRPRDRSATCCRWHAGGGPTGSACMIASPAEMKQATGEGKGAT